MRIVDKYTKIDLHIHSSHSFAKDGSLVSNGTKENISNVLVPKLEEYGVNMASITDHNTFSFEYYLELKSHENKGNSLLKVLPGVEFDLDIEENSVDTHAIAIFDDKDEEKVKEIETILNESKKAILKENHISEENLLFKPVQIIDIFRKIGLNFVLIVHQKADPENSKVEQEHNIANLGLSKFNELVSYDYFDAIEFKNYKVEGFLLAHKHKYNSSYNALCGSDCHVWELYPKHDEKDNNVYNFCYTNALPTFKGLAMALTGDTRIHFSDNSIRKPYLDKIDFNLNDHTYSISLSPGLNVLIGDNSIGKSFFLEKLNNPELSKDIVNDSTFSKKLDGYKTFCQRMHFDITSKTLETDGDNVVFHRQGHIRSLFEGGNKSIEDQPFLTKFFPVINTQLQEQEVHKIITDFIDYEKIVAAYKTQTKSISNLTLTINTSLSFDTYNISLLVDKDSIPTNNYNKIINGLHLAKTNINNVIADPLLTKSDKEQMEKVAKIIEAMLVHYTAKKKLEVFKEESYASIVASFKNLLKTLERDLPKAII